MIKLTKQYSRERSLVYTYVWYIDDVETSNKWLNIPRKNMIYIREPNSGKVSVWYEDKEYEDFLEKSEKLISDAGVFKKIIDETEKELSLIKPIFDKNKIDNIDEFDFLFEHYTNFWINMYIPFYVPDFENATPEQKKICLDLRHKTEKYSDQFDQLAMDFIKKDKILEPIADVITPTETSKYFRGEKIDLDKVQKRKTRGVVLFNGELYYFDELPQILEKSGVELEQFSTEDVKEIKGSVAFKGKVTGKVRVVLEKSQLSMVQRGDILVAEMTSPEYLPYMEKSAAVVTDEGGITCHAAVVCREMKKPCVIGTKVGTRALKDGMEVEVDAEKGIVKILK